MCIKRGENWKKRCASGEMKSCRCMKSWARCERDSRRKTSSHLCMTVPLAAPKLRAGLKDADNAIRYWSALGLLMRAKDAVSADMPGLRGLLQDESKPVRIVAAEALAQWGEKGDLDASLKVLLECGHPKQNSIYNSLAALNALDRLGERARPVLPMLKDWPTEGMPAGHRAAPGIARLLAKITRP